MQINSGTISINTAVNAALVQGDSNVDWTQVNTSCLFIAQGASYKITSVNAGAKQITISPAWAGGTVVGIAYAIQRDFTLNHSLPLLNPGDLEAAAIFTRAMQVIDEKMGLVGSTTNEITVNVGSPTTFIVGNALGFSASGFFLCRIDDATKQLPIGVVTWVAGDGLSFKIKTEGYVSGIQGITLTAGSKYYIRYTPVSGGGQLVNLTAVTGEAGSVLVPVLIASGTNSGYLVNLASAQTSIFGVSTNGLVPGPSSVVGNFLRDDGTWQALGITDGTIESRHLKTTPTTINWANFATGTAGLSVLKHIVDLQNRLLLIEGGSSNVTPTVPTDVKIAYNRQVFTWATNPAGTWTANIPAGITSAIVTLIGPGRGAWIKGYRPNISFGSIVPDMDITPSGTNQVQAYAPLFTRVKFTGLTTGDTIGGTLGYLASASPLAAVTPSDLYKSAVLYASVGTSIVIHGSLTQYQSGVMDPRKVAGILNPAGTEINGMPSNTYYLVTLWASTPQPGGTPATIQYGFANKGIAIVEWGNGANIGFSV